MAQRDLIKTYNLTLMKWISNVALTETLEPVKKKKSKPWAQPLAQSFMTTCKTSPKFWKFSWYSMVFHFLPAKAIVPRVYIHLVNISIRLKTSSILIEKTESSVPEIWWRELDKPNLYGNNWIYRWIWTFWVLMDHVNL